MTDPIRPAVEVFWDAVDAGSIQAAGPCSDLECHLCEQAGAIIEADRAAIRADERAKGATFQPRVDEWVEACFGGTIRGDTTERADRFIEEALELAQTIPAFTADRAHTLVDYVFNRPVGEPAQEVGGVMVTLAALCNATGLDITSSAETELARVWTKMAAIRAKQAAKPTGSALPVAIERGEHTGGGDGAD